MTAVLILFSAMFIKITEQACNKYKYNNSIGMQVNESLVVIVKTLIEY